MTALFSTSGLFKVFECFAVFTCVVLHRIGNRGSQVGGGDTKITALTSFLRSGLGRQTSRWDTKRQLTRLMLRCLAVEF